MKPREVAMAAIYPSGAGKPPPAPSGRYRKVCIMTGRVDIEWQNPIFKQGQQTIQCIFQTSSSFSIRQSSYTV